MLNNILIILQIIVSVLLVGGVLLQQKGSAMGSAFGQEGGGAVYGTKRGAQKKIFWATVVLGGLFIILSVLNLIV